MTEDNMGENEHRHGMAAYCLDIISSQMERTIKRLWALCIILCVLLAASWGGFLWYEAQYETVAYEQDGEGINSVNFGTQGDLNNGAENKVSAQEER